MNKSKIFLLWIECKIISLVEKIYSLKKKEKIYSNSRGIKILNGVHMSAIDCVNRTTIYLDAEELYLGLDFLKDVYTLANCPVISSPHYKLIEELDRGCIDESNPYIVRMLNGTLDERKKIVSPLFHKEYFYNRFEKNKKALDSNEYEEVVVYCVKGRYYIFDGKHRAAFCAYLGKKIKCRVVENWQVKKAIDPNVIKKMDSKYSSNLGIISGLSSD